MEIAEEQAKDKVWSEVISWVEQGCVLEKTETRVKAREVLVACSMFDPTVVKMKDEALMFTKAANKNRIGEVWRICLLESIANMPLESMVMKVWSLCHQSNLGGHRGLEGKLNKFYKRFFLLSARQKICFLNGGCESLLN